MATTIGSKPHYYVPYSSPLKKFTSTEIIYTDFRPKGPLKQRSNGNGNASDLPEPITIKAINAYIRQHPFLQLSLNEFTTSQRRAFERNVYDYSRSLKLSKPHAKIEVRKARGICGETMEDSDQSTWDGELDDSLDIKERLLEKGKGDGLNGGASSPDGDSMVVNKSLGTLAECAGNTVLEYGNSTMEATMPNELLGTSKRKRSKAGGSEVPQHSRKKRKESDNIDALPVGRNLQQESTGEVPFMQENADENSMQPKNPSLNETSERKGNEKAQAQKRKKIRAENAKAAKRAKNLDAVAAEKKPQEYGVIPESCNIGVRSEEKHPVEGNSKEHGVMPELSEIGIQTKVKTPSEALNGGTHVPLKNGATPSSTAENNRQLTAPTTDAQLHFDAQTKHTPQALPDPQLYSGAQTQIGGSEEGEIIQVGKPARRHHKSRKSSKSPNRTSRQSSLKPQPLLDEQTIPLSGASMNVDEGEKGIESSVHENSDLVSKETAPTPALIPPILEAPEKPKKRKKPKKTKANVVVESISDTKEPGRLKEKDVSAEAEPSGDAYKQPLIIVDHLASLQESTAPLRKPKKAKKFVKAEDKTQIRDITNHEQQGQNVGDYSFQHQNSLEHTSEQRVDKPRKGRKRKAVAEDEEEVVTRLDRALDYHNLEHRDNDEGEAIMAEKPAEKPTETEKAHNDYSYENGDKSEQALELNLTPDLRKSTKTKTKSSTNGSVLSEQDKPDNGAMENMDFRSPMIYFPGESDVVCQPEASVEAQHQGNVEQAPLATLPSNESSPLSSLQSTPEFPSEILPDNVPFMKLELDEELDETKAAFSTPLKSQKKTPKLRGSKVSPYFSKCPQEKISCIPFPALDSTSFGLVQERLCHDPFLLLIAVLFLNKTRGTVSLPTFYNVIAHYPTPFDMAYAKQEDLMQMIHHLGLQNQRATRCISIAKTWLENPPQKGIRYRRLHYPKRNDGKDITANSGPIDDDDPRVAWEIGHLSGIGAYAIDSWRIFCRDELRGLPSGLPHELTSEAVELEMQKEWTRVLPLDKELRAYLRWRWLRLGWQWDPLTGNRKEVSPEVLKLVKNGGVIFEGDRRWALHAKDSVNEAEWTSVVQYNHILTDEGFGDESLMERLSKECILSTEAISPAGPAIPVESIEDHFHTEPAECLFKTEPALFVESACLMKSDPLRAAAKTWEPINATKPLRSSQSVLHMDHTPPLERTYSNELVENETLNNSKASHGPSKIIKLKLPRWRVTWSGF